MKDCGGCANFLKIRNFDGNSGICVYLDGRTDTDNGHKCKYFKPLKYVRKPHEYSKRTKRRKQ